MVDQELESLLEARINPDTSNDDFQAYLDKVEWGSIAGGHHGGHSWLLRGLYALQLNIYLEFFPPSAFCIVDLEELAEDANAVMHRIHRHLGIPEETLPAEELVPKNARSYRALTEKEQQLTQFFQPFMARWEEMCIRFGWKTSRTALPQ